MNQKTVLIIKLILVGIGLSFCFVPMAIALLSEQGFEEFQTNLFMSICFGCLALAEFIDITVSVINKETISPSKIGIFIGLITVIIINLI